MRVLFYIILLAGIGNAVLRPEIENPFTLYRVIAPVGLFAVFFLRPWMVMRGIWFFLLFFAYNFALARIYSSDLSQFYPSMVHYFYLFILLLMMVYMKYRYADFNRSFVHFLQGFYLFLLVNLVFEFIFGSYYPNLYEDETGERALRAFFWNQNDLAVVLCVYCWFVLSDDRYRGLTRGLVLLLTIAVLYYNDSKAALLSLLLASIPVAIIFKLCGSFRISANLWKGFFACAALCVGAAILAISETDIVFENDTYTLNDLIITPIVNILSLESSGETWGSLNNRTDAAIFVTIEYFRSLGFGLGAGGSWLVLSLPQYELGGAQSPHNAFLQFTVDLGYPFLLGYVFLLFWAARRLFAHGSDPHTRLKVMAILSFPLLGLSQSGAILTNYFFFAAVFFVWLLGMAERTRQPVGASALTSENLLPFPPTGVGSGA